MIGVQLRLTCKAPSAHTGLVALLFDTVESNGEPRGKSIHPTVQFSATVDTDKALEMELGTIYHLTLAE